MRKKGGKDKKYAPEFKISVILDMENFFGRLKTEMFYGETFQSTDEFIRTLEEYLWYYNNERISLKLKRMSPVQYRTHSQI